MGKREDNALQKKKLQNVLNKIDRCKEEHSSVFLYRREAKIRIKLHFKGWNQKFVAGWLKISESYLTRLISGERYSKDFEIWLQRYLEIDYRFM